MKKGIMSKTKLFSYTLSSLVLASLCILPINANAQSLQTRTTSDMIEVRDVDGLVTARLVREDNTSQGIQSISGLGNEIDYSDFRGGFPTSRVNCPDTPGYIYDSAEAAEDKYQNCFDNSTYLNIERDLKYLIENQGVKKAFYYYAHPVRIQDENAPNGYEQRYIHSNVYMTSADDIGDAKRLGVVVTLSAESVSIYVHYENSKAVNVLGSGVVMPGAGQAKVYTLEGATPENSKPKLVETITGRESDFDTSTDGVGSFDPSGIKNLIVETGGLMDRYNAQSAVIDYGNPISIKMDSTNDGTEDLVASNVVASVPNRFYYKNECTAEGVVYGQETVLKTDVEYRRDRYIINDRSQANAPVNLESITSIIGIQDSYDMQNAPVDTVEQKYAKNYSGYDFDKSFDYFANKLADPIGDRSTPPDNLFNIGQDDPYNSIPYSAFKKGGIETLRDETIKDITYYVMVEKEAGYFETRTRTYEDIVGYDENNQPIYGTITEEYQAWVPPVYEQEEREACIHNTQVAKFCDIYDCTGDEDVIEGEEPEGYYWDIGSWGSCSVNCGEGVQSRSVVCRSSDGSQVSPSNCSAGSKPITSKTCTGGNQCGYTWSAGEWSDCSRVCNGGIKTRDVYCQSPNGTRVSEAFCEAGDKPASQGECNTQQCGYKYEISDWSSCKESRQCEARGFSVGWIDGYWKTLEGKRENGFNATHFQCSYSISRSCPNSYGSDSLRTTYKFGEQHRSVKCIRTDDSKEVDIGYCGQTQPYTYKECSLGTTRFGHCSGNGGGRD